ncbi:MAG: hypothetical protein MUP41_14120 [Desulfobacterales bacterium]|nr:hypothetical protein [Desulfobacterales bacterium]
MSRKEQRKLVGEPAYTLDKVRSTLLMFNPTPLCKGTMTGSNADNKKAGFKNVPAFFVIRRQNIKLLHKLLPQIGLFWSGVRGLPPAFPLVEDVSLLILTPLVV